MTPLNSPHRAFSPARHASFRFPQTRAAVLLGGVGGVFLLSVQHGGEYTSTVFGYI